MSVSGRIFDIKKYAIHDGPGIRTTVFLMGCPLDCWWCHNPECREGLEGRSGRDVSVGEVVAEIMKDTVFYDESGGGVTFSGGEPMTQPEFLSALLKECKAKGIHTTVDTCGYADFANYEAIYDLVDLFLYDLKLMNDSDHIRYTGVSNELILENLARLASLGPKIKLRVPMIPGITDTDENLEAIRDFAASLPSITEISLLPYNELGHDKLKRLGLNNRLGTLRPQDKDIIKKKGKRFELGGFKVKIGG